MNGRTATRRGRHNCSAEARREVALRWDKLEPVDKSHELESAPKPTITESTDSVVNRMAFDYSGLSGNFLHRSAKQFPMLQTYGTDKKERAALGPASRSPHQYNCTGSVHSKH